jgi:broad specificity phosphatase PhoE
MEAFRNAHPAPRCPGLQHQSPLARPPRSGLAQRRRSKIRHQGLGRSSLPFPPKHFHYLTFFPQCYYSALDGFDSITWADATLTPLGQHQALAANSLWKQQIPHGIPIPETYYVSPLTRTIETADLTFNGIDGLSNYKPYIKELCREALGIHTCDRRSTKTHLESTFPHLTFEPNFSDADVLWEKDYREPESARRYRLSVFLDDVFEQDGNVFVSVTSHSGAIASVLEAVGHRRFGLETGGVIPVVVRAERVEGRREVPEREPSDAPEMCTEPPEL